MSTNRGESPLVFTEPVAQFRLLLGDTDPVPLDPPEEGYGRYKFYSDDEVSGLIDMYAGDVPRAAVRGLDAIAGSEVLKERVWTTDDLAVRGDLITESLRKLSAKIQADIDAAESRAERNDENLEFSFFAPEFTWERAEGDFYANPWASVL